MTPTTRQAAAWRAATQHGCSDCGRTLGWLEGPVCDRCLDEDELEVPPSVCYDRLRDSDKRGPRVRFSDESSVPLPGYEGETFTPLARDSLCVDLQTGVVTVFQHRDTPTGVTPTMSVCPPSGSESHAR